jgi:hypothetical protein
MIIVITIRNIGKEERFIDKSSLLVLLFYFSYFLVSVIETLFHGIFFKPGNKH